MKRDYGIAWSSFINSSEGSKALKKLRPDEWQSRAGTPSQAVKAYNYIYDTVQTEQEANERMIKLIEEWAANPQFRYNRSMVDLSKEMFQPPKPNDMAKAREYAQRAQNKNQGKLSSKELAEQNALNEKRRTFDAEQEELKRQKKADKKLGTTMRAEPGVETGGFDAAANYANQIAEITGVKVSPDNKNELKKVVNALYKSGDVDRAMPCTQAALNIEAIYEYESMRGESDGYGKDFQRILDIYTYVSGILGWSSFGSKNEKNVGTDYEKTLIKTYNDIMKKAANVNDAVDVTRLMKEIVDAATKEVEWFAKVSSNPDVARRSDERFGLDGGGYASVWNNISGRFGKEFFKQPGNYSICYKQYHPWDGNSRAGVTGTGEEVSWDKLTEAILTKFEADNAVNEKLYEGSKNVVKDAVDRFIENKETPVETEETTETVEVEKPKSSWDNVKDAGKSFLQGFGSLGKAVFGGGKK